jgi:hypothetical protein
MTTTVFDSRISTNRSSRAMMAVSRSPGLLRASNGSRMTNIEPKLELVADSTNDMPEMVIVVCQRCHTVVDRSAWDRIVVGHMSDVDRIGTDPAMAENSVNRRGKSGNFKDTYQQIDVGNVIVQEDAPVVQILTSATKGVIATPDASPTVASLALLEMPRIPCGTRPL